MTAVILAITLGVPIATPSAPREWTAGEKAGLQRKCHAAISNRAELASRLTSDELERLCSCIVIRFSRAIPGPDAAKRLGNETANRQLGEATDVCARGWAEQNRSRVGRDFRPQAWSP